MSASHDKSQRITFIYSNMYKIYKSGETHALISPTIVTQEDELEENLKKLQSLGERIKKMLEGLRSKFE